MTDMRISYLIVLIALTGTSAHPSVAQDRQTSTTDSLWQRFVCPPDNARTKVWWFHGETETTRHGITADLEAFRDKGVGGVVYYDQVHGKGEDASAVFSPEWWDDLKFAASESKRLGLTFELNISNGYVAGGPWIGKEDAMQKVVYTDTLITCDGKHDVILPAPHYADFCGIATLAFPDIHTDDSRVTMPDITVNAEGIDPQLLLAANARLQRIDRSGTMITMDFGSSFTASSFTYKTKGRAKAATCAIPIPCTPGQTYAGAGYVELPPIGELEVSDDGIHYNKVCTIPPLYRSMGYKLDQITVAFPVTTGRYFRVNLHDWNPSTVASVNPPSAKPASSGAAPLMMGGIRLSGAATADNWEVKAAFRPEFPEYAQPKVCDNTASSPCNDRKAAFGSNQCCNQKCTDFGNDRGIDPSSMIDISCHTLPNGSLRWRAPKGTWRVMAFGHVPTGAKTKHGRKGLSGLECDRMSAKAAWLQWENFFARMCDTLTCAGTKPDGLVMDSHEAGAQNWTHGFENEFRMRRGYDIIPWLPALSGRIVGSRTETDRMLYDFRRTIADLISDKFYATTDSLCRSAGVSFTAQAIGAALTIAGDNIQAKGRVRKPQGEFWAYQTTGGYDIKEASSAARMYGSEISSAEAFTDATYRHSFAQLKSLADFAYAMGNNEFVVCASAYQPWTDRVPGSTANGRQYCLNRNNTLWSMSSPFWDYQARCAAMLRQGHAAACICIYIGDDAPVKLLSHKLPAMPEGYDWDVCTTDALLNAIGAESGKIVTKSGTKYEMLIIGNGACVPPAALARITEMAEHGVPVCADRDGMESIAELYGWDTAEYAELLTRLFAMDNVHRLAPLCQDTDSQSQEGSIAAAMHHHGILPQLGIHTANIPTDKVYFSQRSTPDNDIFFVYNRSVKPFRDTVSIRTCHKTVELWNPLTCRRKTVAVKPLAMTEQSGKTDTSAMSQTFFIELQPEESVFVVSSDMPSESANGKNQNNNNVTATADGHSHHAAKENKHNYAVATMNDHSHSDTIKVTGPWTVNFDPQRGGPSEAVVFTELTDWTTNTDSRIKYYSGEATYTTTFDIANDRSDGSPADFDTADDSDSSAQDSSIHTANCYTIRLNGVKSLARIVVNGHDATTLWCSPWQADITGFVRPRGRNTLQIVCANSLVNRIIGDASLPEAERVTYSFPEFMTSDDKLEPSGIVGDVEIIVSDRCGIQTNAR